MTEELKKRIAQINAGTAPAGYKKTKVGVVPEDWETLKAKKVFRNRSDKKHDGTLEVLSVTQDRGVIPRSQVDIDIKYDKDSTTSYKRVYTGDFVISLRSFQGGIEYSEYDGIVSPAYTVIEAFTPICDDYYRAYFKSPTYIQRLNTAVYGIRDGKNISFDDFSQIYIPCPPLPEQQKIAEILTAQDEVIALIQKQIETLKKQKKAFLQKMFPKKGSNVPEIRFAGFTDAWEQRKLGEICEVITKGTTPKDKNWVGPVNYIKTESIDKESGNITNTCNTSLEEHNGFLKRSQLKANDVLFSIVGTLGRVGLVKNKDLPANTNQQIAIIRPVEDNSIFIMNMLKTSAVESFITSDSTIGAQPSISLWQLDELTLSFPKLEEQVKIANYFSNLDNLLTLHQRKLEIEQQKKKALMQLLLTGKVRVKP